MDSSSVPQAFIPSNTEPQFNFVQSSSESNGYPANISTPASFIQTSGQNNIASNTEIFNTTLFDNILTQSHNWRSQSPLFLNDSQSPVPLSTANVDQTTKATSTTINQRSQFIEGPQISSTAYTSSTTNSIAQPSCVSAINFTQSQPLDWQQFPLSNIVQSPNIAITSANVVQSTNTTNGFFQASCPPSAILPTTTATITQPTNTTLYQPYVFHLNETPVNLTTSTTNVRFVCLGLQLSIHCVDTASAVYIPCHPIQK